MSPFRQLVRQTACARREFIEMPLIQEVMRKGASRALYLDFLRQAYHHVRCTAPLLALAASRCGSDDRRYQTALFEYIHEERGHDEWILEDIEALGGDPHSVRHGSPHFPCRIMIGHAYYLVDHVSPYALLGMIHVLEGMAVALAGNAARAMQNTIATTAGAGFKYLTTHGDLDVKHTKMFETLIDEISPQHMSLIIVSACDFYRLYGDIFRDLDRRRAAVSVAC